MSFTARPQAFALRARTVLAQWNQGDGVRSRRPTGTEARQLAAVVGGTFAFVVVVLALALVAFIAR